MLFTAVFAGEASAQKAPASPPAKDSVVIGGKVISVKYAAPSVKGRDIFGAGGLLSREKNFPVWRAGANSATTFHTDADLEIGGLSVPKGDYTLYVSLVDPQHWELIINKQLGQWGLTYDQAQDLGRVKMTMGKIDPPVEVLFYKLTLPQPNKVKIALTWEKMTASVDVKVKK
ncbi:DUF2911 domain-containing protein [Pedobacter sp. HMF7056]|uniref:DUF2911 domain-containing protein n=2 Tax=Hufsiella ginkgonis TaxID=2695274 RepID=A0A7K1XVB0_9SPHI|nr:DUF2911 domain-containing protein [Hufsiella ginkgonis]